MDRGPACARRAVSPLRAEGWRARLHAAGRLVSRALGFAAVQAVRGVLAREEHAVFLAFVARAVHLSRGNVEPLPRAAAQPLLVELHFELAFEHVDPLLVRVRMRL